MKISRIPFITSCLAALIIIPMALAGKITPLEKAYIGGYTKTGVDSVARLVLLDDNTFCYSFSGGSLDLLIAGRWKNTATKTAAISLQEVKVSTPAFPVSSVKTEIPGNKVIFDFDGYSLSRAVSPVFAISNNDKPTSLSPLFSDDDTSWAESYKLPPINADKALYFFIGYLETDKFNNPLRVKVSQYKIAGGHTIHVGFNNVAATAAINMSAQLANNILYVDGEVFANKDVLPTEIIEDVRQSCTYPILQPDKVVQKANNENDFLIPVKDFYLELNAIQGAPIIDRKNPTAINMQMP